MAPAYALDTRGHVEGAVPHARPVAHHPRFSIVVRVRVTPGFVERPPGNIEMASRERVHYVLNHDAENREDVGSQMLALYDLDIHP